MSIMSYSFVERPALGLALVAAVAWTVGCGEKQETTPAAPSGDAMGHDHGQAMPGHEMAHGADAADATIPAGLAELSTEDRELALRQKVCPVSDDVLGDMGAPIKLTIDGHEVFICCPSCEEPLRSDPAKYLAKLGLEPAAE